MLDVPVSVVLISLVVGGLAGGLFTFLVLDHKVQRLQAECRRRAAAAHVEAVRRG